MGHELKKKYGLSTAIAMVVGIVIGSGVFFKAEKVLVATGGDLKTGILAWFLGGLVMILCGYNFAVLATKHENVGGIVDYAEVMCGHKYGYMMAWFMQMVYYPAFTGVLAWVSARYFSVLMGWDIVGGQCMILSGFILVVIYSLNALTPKLAGKFQVSTTVIKLIPLFLMAIVGTIYGTKNGILLENFTTVVTTDVSEHPLFTAVVGTSFAYEGWICATSINAELQDAKRNLPRALVIGTLFVALTYILYYVGLAGAVENQVMMEGGETGAKLAFTAVFSEVGGTLLFLVVTISAIGTLNGLMMACVRGMYAIAVRDEGPFPHFFSKLDSETNMPYNSATVGLLLAMLWLVYFYGANLTAPWFGKFSFDSSELPCISLYSMYIPIFAMQMKKGVDFGSFNRYVAPVLGICACLFMIVAAVVSLGEAIIYYLIIYAVIMVIGVALKKFGHTKA